VPEDFIVAATRVHGEIDDRTVAYILESRKTFEDLRQVAAQLAGLLVLAAAGSKSAAPDHPMLEAAMRLHRSASDEIKQAQPTSRAHSHHDYLLQASISLTLALSRARANFVAPPCDDLKINQILGPLQTAYAQLRLASAELPGFEMISFEQGCCAVAHANGERGHRQPSDRITT
jgi:hypothetical protein